MLHKTANSMVPVPTKVTDNSRRERNLAVKHEFEPDVVREGACNARIPTRVKAHMHLARIARLHNRGDADGVAFRRAIPTPTRPNNETCEPDVRKRTRKYKGKLVARTHRY